MLKAIVAIIAVLIGTIIVVRILVSPTLKATDICFQEEARRGIALYDQMKLLSSKQERTQLFCEEDTKTYTRLKECVQQAKTKSALGGLFLTLWPQYQSTMANSANTHNQLCPDSLLR